MLAKFLSILFGVLGVTTVTLYPPTQTSPITPRPAISTSTATMISEANRTADFSLLKSASSTSSKKNSSPATSTATSKTKKTPPKPAVNPIESVTSSITTNSSASSSLPTYQPQNLATSTPPVNWNLINQTARNATVNILCTSKSGGSFEPLSGSGVIIDPHGIILTNAHVAQYFLLKDYRIPNFITCVARNGSPATPKYTLKLLYISQQWLNGNYQKIVSTNPTGTGENDYALFQITGRTDPDLNLETSFPYLGLEENEDKINSGDSAIIAAYPAGFLGGIAIQRDLYQISSIITIGERYTFRNGTVDAFSLGGSPVAQHGSSGGAVVNYENKLIGIVVTSTTADTTDKRDLDAISISHISRSLLGETNLSLGSFLKSDIEAFSKAFDEEILPSLKKLLTDQISKPNK